MSSTQKRLAAKILKCGVQRVWIDPKSEKIKQAITRSDMRGFIKDGIVKKHPEKKRAVNTPKRQQRAGSIKGSRKARIGKKNEWFKKVRPQREMLMELREGGKLTDGAYREIYKKIKGGMFRSRAHLQLYLTENKLLKEGK